MNDGDAALEISFAKPIVLENLDRRRIGVGVEIVRVVAHHPAKIGHHVGRKNVLVGDDSHRFKSLHFVAAGGWSLALARVCCTNSLGMS